ncbi:pyrroline-5-carboxylate reductase [Clostridium sp. WLY-B-L2]|jgi:pyrroline-5-carboxylate reductase|uniref:Pyrroline-5-carboxylate reductase n=1 Tax=Clostridium aromativorans TaxID=2836848 RepID=A0ABS8N3C6_9CLOT|nr:MULTISPECIES: pyrroline-5-carboxylate reductase [Clostridium]KAA8679366.1 pyrroline-5-carboxylate reductase [Clostridium sp. HV4-5-A1G]MCC9294304.1 pyrroline-5-carboxylate reductase [Clostridium aromativorans]CAB1262479.1 Pyrroline-5-carboxylate reductase [Clostridiaceae bacterium BL-3]
MGTLNKKIGFIGAGQMGEAIIRGLLKSKLFSPEDIYAMDILDSRLEYLKENFGVTNSSSDKSTGYDYLVDNCDIVILSIKPQVLKEVLGYIQKSRWNGEKQLVISIVGGMNTSVIEKYLTEVPLVRIIPNTPMLVNAGAAGIAPGKNAEQRHTELVIKIFKELGITFLVQENLIDSVMAISGCGPAYIYMLIEAMADGGVELGLPRDIAQTLAAQTALGAAKMVLETHEHPGALKDRVCSPGGSTIAGVRTLEQGGFRGTVINAVEIGKTSMEKVAKKSE